MIDLEIARRLVSTLASRFIAFVPTLIATLLILAAGWLLSRLAQGLVRRFLERLELDERVAEGDLDRTLSRIGFERSPSQLMARLVFWLFFLCFIVLALENLGLDFSQLPVRSFIGYLPAVLGAILILIAGTLLAAFLGRATDAALAGMGIDQHRRLGGLVRVLLLAITLVVVVEQLGFDVSLLSQTFANLLTIIAAGLVLTFAWGGKEVARNVLAGYYVREQFAAGDRLVLEGREATVEEVGPLSTRLRTERGALIVPNRSLVESAVETVEG